MDDDLVVPHLDKFLFPQYLAGFRQHTVFLIEPFGYNFLPCPQKGAGRIDVLLVLPVIIRSELPNRTVGFYL